tara:strand:- start:77 stop:541 length:465 start_codon:yes stop_codon:yes gene_type:complete
MHHNNIPDLLLAYICFTKANQMWFHAAHHVTKGKGFAGDHELLYGKIYESLTEDLDALIERAIGYTDSEIFACPIVLSQMTASVLQNFCSPSDQSDEEIVEIAYDTLERLIQNLESLHQKLYAADQLSLGLEDLLAGFANQYETYIYMLKQRLK